MTVPILFYHHLDRPPPRGIPLRGLVVSPASFARQTSALKLRVATKPLLTVDEWRLWMKAGMELGSHTRTHAKLTELSPEEAQRQIVDAKRELEEMSGQEVRHFCYPYGSFEPEHCAMVRQAGYVTATTMNRGRNQAGDDPYQLRRIMVACSTHLALFLTKVLTGYEDRRR